MMNSFFSMRLASDQTSRLNFRDLCLYSSRDVYQAQAVMFGGLSNCDKIFPRPLQITYIKYIQSAQLYVKNVCTVQRTAIKYPDKICITTLLQLPVPVHISWHSYLKNNCFSTDFHGENWYQCLLGKNPCWVLQKRREWHNVLDFVQFSSKIWQKCMFHLPSQPINRLPPGMRVPLPTEKPGSPLYCSYFYCNLIFTVLFNFGEILFVK